jgi:hypothetical protein
VALTVLVPYEVADRCYLSEAILWAAFSRLPLEILNDQADTRDEGSYDTPFWQSSGIEPVTSDECNRVGLPSRPIWKSVYSHLGPSDIRREIDLERSEEKKNELRKAFFEAERFQRQLTEWEGKLSKFTEQCRFELLQALHTERLGATGKKLPLPTIDGSFKFMDDLTESGKWAPPKYVDREPIPADFWSSAEIAWDEGFAEGSLKDRKIAYGLILVEVAQLFNLFPLPNGEAYGGVRKAGDYLVLTSDDDIRGRAELGRPPYNWDEFHLEMAKRVGKGLPEQKKVCISEMQEWFMDKSNKRVAESTLAQKIKPYYDEFVWKSETRKD